MGGSGHRPIVLKPALYRNPCLYQPDLARVTPGPRGRLIETTGTGIGIIWDTQKTFQFDTDVIYDEATEFFRMINVGYIGKIDVLNEIK